MLYKVLWVLIHYLYEETEMTKTTRMSELELIEMYGTARPAMLIQIGEKVWPFFQHGVVSVVTARAIIRALDKAMISDKTLIAYRIQNVWCGMDTTYLSNTYRVLVRYVLENLDHPENRVELANLAKFF